MKKHNTPIYYQRPYSSLSQEQKEEIVLQKEIEEENKRNSILSMTPEERDYYYKEQELELQRKMLQAQALSLQQQNEQLKIQNKQFDSMAKCPRCGSTSLSGQKKGYGVVKGALGSAALGAMTGGIGAIVGLGVGNIGRNKVTVTCMNCGHKFKA